MITRFNRDYKQTFCEVENEFPDCKFLMLMDSAEQDDGYLIAVSDSPDTTKELCNLEKEYPDAKGFCIGGLCEDTMSVGAINYS